MEKNDRRTNLVVGGGAPFDPRTAALHGSPKKGGEKGREREKKGERKKKGKKERKTKRKKGEKKEKKKSKKRWTKTNQFPIHIVSFEKPHFRVITRETCP